MVTRRPKLIHQFKITLLGISPPVWRRIQVPASYTFWDLHVAIQDSMGWLDYHLHAFRLEEGGEQRAIEIGIPTDEYDGDAVVPGWAVAIARIFTRPGLVASYEYDFGDGWRHQVLLEDILPSEPKVRYPRCLAGKRACPPEDCGGTHGYREVLKALKNSRHPEHKDTVAWLKGHVASYYPYDPARFEPHAVVFSNPRRRWQNAFGRD